VFVVMSNVVFNSSNAELNPICNLLALLGAHRIFHVSVIRVKTDFKICNFIPIPAVPVLVVSS